MTRQNLVDFNFADPFYQYPERRRLRSHGNRNHRNKKVKYNIAEIISNYNHTFPEYLISTLPQPRRMYRHTHRPRKQKIAPNNPSYYHR